MDIAALFPEHAEYEALIRAGLPAELPDSIIIENLKFAYKVELGELANEVGFFKHWKRSHAKNPKKILEEWSDGLHFLISIGNLCKYNQFVREPKVFSDAFHYPEFVPMLFNTLMESPIHNSGNFLAVLTSHLDLGYNLGFSEEELMLGYHAKLNKNINRQHEGY